MLFKNRPEARTSEMFFFVVMTIALLLTPFLMG